MVLTLWRKKLYEEIKNHNFNGELLDLGGSRSSGYHELMGKDCNITAVNFDEKYKHDLSFDLEKNFPLEDNKYDSISCFNVLEHVFNYQGLLRESKRVLKKEGELVIGVPFLIQVHPCPHDYWRFSGEALKKILEKEGFKDVQIKEVGTGVFGAAYQLKYNIYKFNIIRLFFRDLSILLDKILDFSVKKNFGSKKYYPLGYFVVAKNGK